jgi:uncharacterized OsmC-like protein
MSRGLPEYLERKAAAIAGSARDRPTGEAWRERVVARAWAGDLTGVRRLRIRDWEWISDSGPAFGGWGLGPSSPELLCGVLATCLTHTYEIMAAQLGLAVERVEVHVSASNNDARFAGIDTDDPAWPWDFRAEVELEAPALSAQEVGRLHAAAEASCPLTNLLRRATEVEVVAVVSAPGERGRSS